MDTEKGDQSLEKDATSPLLQNGGLARDPSSDLNKVKSPTTYASSDDLRNKSPKTQSLQSGVSLNSAKAAYSTSPKSKSSTDVGCWDQLGRRVPFGFAKPRSDCRTSHIVCIIMMVTVLALAVITLVLLRVKIFSSKSSTEFENCGFDWENFQREASIFPKLVIQVTPEGESQPSQSCSKNSKLRSSKTVKTNGISTAIRNFTFILYGQPNFCKETTGAEPSLELSFTNDLHIRKMEGCNNYLTTIFENWNFPKLNHIYLQSVRIEKDEFAALNKFITRHGETLQSLEIDQSYLCPSPYCDADLINFPNDQFEISITRRKESSEVK